jgi:hypothetical protein
MSSSDPADVTTVVPKQSGHFVRTSMVALALLILCIPLAAVVTIVLLPVWSWLEARFAIESVGHSGPADWCYGVVYAGCVMVIASGVLWGRRRAR